MRKKLMISLSILCFAAFSANAQVWFELGPRVNYGLTGFYNSNIIGDDAHDYQLSGGLSYGGVLGINFGENNGLNLEGLLTTNKQKVSFRDPVLGPFDASWEWETIDILVLYRYYTDGGAYFEVGPKASIVNSITQEANGIDIPTENAYSDLYFSGVGGLGALLAGSEVYSLKMGLRLEYALTDLLDNQTDVPDYPAVYTRYESEAGTYPFRATIGLELTFGIGGVAKSTCGRRGFVFGSRYR